ncbi:MAG: aspartate aminotransferase family protein [Candidatus Eisenbacteria bacterium]|nr:aspartate aminotransferase family protein [Candidatus Eisenbacteria bacterium]
MTHILQCHDIVKTDLVRGEGCHLFDSRGARFTDFESGIWSAALGHGHPRITAVIREQSAALTHLGTRYPSPLAERAAVDILGTVGMGEGKCVLLSSGSEAVEFGVQVARRFSGKPLLLTLAHSYLAAYGSAGAKRSGEWCEFDAGACTHTGPCDCLDAIPFADIGAFVFEPGGSGMAFVKFPPQRLVEEIARRVRAHGGLLMANEVTTGMGRTGRWFGFQHYGVQPDVVALGKGLGNGYPVSAVAMRPEVAERVERGGFHYAQSHQNDPLGCAVASEVIAVLREELWVDRGERMGQGFLESLKQLVERHAVLREARGRGLLLGLEFHPHERLSAASVYAQLVEQGFLVGCYPAGNMLRFSPPLVIAREDIDGLITSVDAILREACRVRPQPSSEQNQHDRGGQ